MASQSHDGDETMVLGNPAPLGLLAFGMTTMNLMYVEMGWCETDFEASVAGTAFFFGGLCQLLVGIFELIRGSSFAFAVFGSYAAFWLGWAFVMTEKHRTTSLFRDASYDDGSVLAYVQWGVLSSCFFLNRALVTVFALLSCTFYLLAIAKATHLQEWKKTAGYFGFVTGLGAFYTAIAELVNEEFRRHVLPGLQPLYSPQRAVITVTFIKSLLEYSRSTNTLLMRFRGLNISTKDDVMAINKAVESTIHHVHPQGKVHVVCDYLNTYVDDNIAEEYWDMVADLQHRYYLSVTRFNVSSFNHNHNLSVAQISPSPKRLRQRQETSNNIFNLSTLKEDEDPV
jgi:uncharacterized protein